MHRWIFTKRKQAQDQDSNFDKENKDFNIKGTNFKPKCKLLYTGDKQSIGHNKQESFKEKKCKLFMFKCHIQAVNVGPCAASSCACIKIQCLFQL